MMPSKENLIQIATIPRSKAAQTLGWVASKMLISLEFSTNMPISYRNVPPRDAKLLIHTQAILDKTSAICQQKTSTNPNTRISDAQTAQI